MANGTGTKYARYAWLLDSMMEEILDGGMADKSDLELSTWFEQFGKIIEWCGTGDDDILPESVKPYLAQKQREMLALTAGPAD